MGFILDDPFLAPSPELDALWDDDNLSLDELLERPVSHMFDVPLPELNLSDLQASTSAVHSGTADLVFFGVQPHGPGALSARTSSAPTRTVEAGTSASLDSSPVDVSGMHDGPTERPGGRVTAGRRVPQPAPAGKVRNRVRERHKIDALEREIAAKQEEIRWLEQSNSNLRREAEVLESAITASESWADVAEDLRARLERTSLHDSGAEPHGDGGSLGDDQGLMIIREETFAAPDAPMNPHVLRNLSVENVRTEFLRVLKAATAYLVDQCPANEQKMAAVLTRVRSIFMHVFLLNPALMAQVESLNLATGSRDVPDSSYYVRVAQALELEPELKVRVRACFTSFQKQLSVIMERRRELVATMPPVNSALLEAPLAAVASPGDEIAKELTENVRKEMVVSALFNICVVKSLTPLQMARLLVHSYPYKPNLAWIIAWAVREQIV